MVDQGNQAQFMLWSRYLQEHYGIILLLLPLRPTVDLHSFPAVFFKKLYTTFAINSPKRIVRTFYREPTINRSRWLSLSLDCKTT